MQLHRLPTTSLAFKTHEILGVHRPGYVIDVVVIDSHHRHTTELVLDCDTQCVRHRCLLIHGHDVLARLHDFAHLGVTELDDRLDELLLLGLDDGVLGSRLDDSEELRLADERTLLEILAFDDQIRDANEQVRGHTQRPEGRQGRHQWRRCSRTPHRVQHRIRFGYRFGQDEEHHHVERNTDHHSRGAEYSIGDHTREGRLQGLEDVDREQERVHPASWVTGQTNQDVAAFVAVGTERFCFLFGDS